MPIRFRCAYCNQLMSISRRKAGAVVPCPKCAGEIIVPMVEGAPAQEEAPVPAPGAAFDDSNFNFAGGTESSPSGPAPAPAETPTIDPPPSPPRRAGVFLPLGVLIVSVGVIMLLLIVVFVLGILIGRAIAPEAKTAAIYPAACPLFSGSVKNPQRSA